MKTIRVAGALLGITVLIAGLFWGNAPVRAAGPVDFDVSSCGVGGNSFNVISADFNGDNELDLAGTLPDDSKAFVVLGNGNGTFQAAATYAVGTAPQGITTGDFNGDSKLDLAVANSGSNNVSVLLGNGDGTFSAAPETPAVGTTPRDITSVRFNSDNNVDLAVVNAASDNVSILLGDGDGTFQTAYTLGTGNGPWGITAADFNGDSKPELAICNRASDNVSILKYAAAGVPVVNPLPSPGVGDSPQGIITGDFNNDNKLDLAVANNASDNVSVLIGNGDGTFIRAVNYLVGTAPNKLVAVDFDGDNKLDLGVSNRGSNNVSILLGNGDGTFQQATNHAVPSRPLGMTTGKFNGDYKNDLIVARNATSSIYVMLNSTYMPGELGFDPSSVSVNENSENVTLTVKRQYGQDGAVNVNYYTADKTAVGGQDYVTNAGTLNLTDGEISKTISVSIIDDDRGESAETFAVTLCNVAGGATLGQANTANVTINENDGSRSAGSIRFDNNEFSFNESNEWAALKVIREDGNSGQVQVDYYCLPGTAEAGIDYSLVSDTLVFSDGQTNAVIRVPLIDDDTQEGEETFKVLLNNPGGGSTLGTPSEATVKILDDESLPPGEITGLTLTTDSGEISATWTDPGNANLAGIHLYIKPEGGNYGQAVDVAKGIETYTFTGLSNGIKYQIKVTTVNSFEIESTGVISEATPVAAEVTGLTLLPGDGQIMVLWHDSRNANLAKIHLYVKPEGGEYSPPIEVAKETETYTCSGLVNGRTYEVKVVTVNGLGVESSGVIKEAVPIAPGALPDLVVNAVQIKGGVYSSGKIKVSFLVANEGQAPSGKCEAAVYILKTPADEPGSGVIKAVSALKPAKSKKVSLNITLPADLAGDNVYLLVVADSSGAVAENDDWNNRFMVTLNLQYPDLAFAAVPVVTGTLEAGATISLQDSIVNQGEAPSGTCVATYYIWDGSDPTSKVKIGERNVAALKPGKASKGKIKFTLPGTLPNSCHILLVIDEADQVKEKDEGNNQASV